MLRTPWLAGQIVTGWCALVGAMAWPCAAEDWPQWGGSNQRNMASSETGLPARFEPGKRRRDHLGVDPSTMKNVAWVARLGTENYSAPIISGGRVFIGTNDAELDDPRLTSTEGGVLLCLDEATGKMLWRLVVPRLEIDRTKVSADFDAMNLGICSSATVQDDCVYLVSNRCEVLCLDVHGLANGNDGSFQDEARFSVGQGQPPIELKPTDADILWRFDMLGDLPVFPHDATNCSVLVHGDFVYAGTGNGVYDGKIVMPSAPSLIVLNKRTGKLVARDDGRISAAVFHGQWSSPSLGTIDGRSQIFFGGGDGWCYAFEPPVARALTPTTLTSAWRFDCNPPGYRARNGRPIDYWALVRGGVRDFIEGGRLTSPSEIIGTPVFYKNRVYATIGQDPVHGPGAGALSCIAANGRGDVTQSGRVWQYCEIGRSMSTVSVANDLVFAAEQAGKVHCLDAQTGQLFWVHNIGDEIWSSTLVADGKLYVGTRRGLVVLAADRQERELANIRLGSAVWSAPTAANGRLFVASQRNLWAITDKGELP
jgi:outer membrane protein assembly factor BamB